MERVLVIGGTRFVGRHLIRRLLDDGKRVTIVSRGKVQDPFGERVERLVADRCDRAALSEAVGSRTWDVVFDQVLYAPDEAAAVCDIFAGKIGRYVMASTQSVFNSGEAIDELAFNPYTHQIRLGSRADFSYEDMKRNAEAVLFQRASFPAAAIRWPLLVGTDDYTGRVWWHVDRVRRGLPIGMPNPDARTSFIMSAEAGRFAHWMGGQTVTGPFNACANGTMSYRDIVTLAEQALGMQAVIVREAAEGDMSPIAWPDHWWMSTAKAEAAGFHFSDLRGWMPGLIEALADPAYRVPEVQM